MQYEALVSFNDNAVQEPRRFKNLTDLALYLERVPGMIGFELRGEATVHLRITDPAKHGVQLKFDCFAY